MTDHVAFQMEFAGMSDVGRSRQRNEDSYNVSKETGLALVCDGMGGHAGGDIASRTAAETIADFIFEYEPDLDDEDERDEDEEDEEDDDVFCDSNTEADKEDYASIVNSPPLDPAVGQSIAIIRAAVQMANRRLVTKNQERGYPEGRGMGTTVVGLWQIEGTDKIVVFHAGDSRLYRLRNGEMRQLTRDHSLYQAWLDNGGQGNPPHRNIIVRALGTMEDVEPEVSIQVVEIDDLFLICSDGLTSMVPDPVISSMMQNYSEKDLSSLCAELIATANEKGGHDNVTVVLARCLPR
ncbi:PPM family protein phosphatase [Azospirillaceae bacterium]